MLNLSFDDLFINLRIGSFNYGYMAQASFQLAHPALSLIFVKCIGECNNLITFNSHARSFVYRNAKSVAKNPDQIKYEIMKIIDFEMIATRTIGAIVGSYWSGQDEVDRSEFIVTLDRIIRFFITPLGHLHFGVIDNLKDATLTFLASTKTGQMNRHKFHQNSSTPMMHSTSQTASSSQSMNDLKEMIDDQHTRLKNVERAAQHEIKQVSMKLGLVMNENADLQAMVYQQADMIKHMQSVIDHQTITIKALEERTESRFTKLYRKIREQDQTERINALLDGLRLTLAVTGKTS